MDRNSHVETVIQPRVTLDPKELKDLYLYRELLFFLVWRDVKVRYKQSMLGILWVVLRPLIVMGIFTVIFGRIAKFPSEGVPYSVFVLAGLIPWGFFSSTLSGSSISVVGSGNLISKVYFPRVIVPIGASFSQMVDVIISFALLLVIMLLYGLSPGAAVVFTPILLVFCAVTALGPGLLFSALFVKYRDVGYIVPFLVQIWMYVTPVIYPVGFIPEKYRFVLYVNPMSGVVEAFRACLFPGKPLNIELLAISSSISIALFVFGLYYFKSVERTFVDNI